jgi:hypothetical protein
MFPSSLAVIRRRRPGQEGNTTELKKEIMEILILLVARLLGQPLKGWIQAVETPAEPVEGLPAIDFDLLTKITPEEGHSRDGERRIVGTPVTA